MDQQKWKRHNYKTFENLDDAAKTEIENILEFDDLLDLVGSHGKYQKLLIFVFLCPFYFFLALYLNNTVFLFSEPDHWCHLPLEVDWLPSKDLWIPRELGPNGKVRFSQCYMYDSPLNHTRIPCRFGLDYDHTHFEDTLLSEFDWACNKQEHVTKALLAANLGGGPGALLIGWAGDKFGRKPSFFSACFALAFFKSLSLFIPKHFTLFLVSQVIMGLGYPAVLLASVQLVMEVVGPDERASVSGLRFTCWILGISFLPFIAFITKHWFYTGLLTSLPIFLTLLCAGFVMESPRWLVSKNRLTEAERTLCKIAKVNGTVARLQSVDLLKTLTRIKATQDNKYGGLRVDYGLVTLFATWRLGRNTLLLCLSFCASQTLLYGINYNATSLPGNPFLNYFALAAVEIPVGWFATIAIQHAGRRWTQTIFFGLAAFSLGLAVPVTLSGDSQVLLITSLALAKFCTGFTSSVFPVQATELLPTNVRSNGMGLISAAVGVSMVFIPLILYMRNLRTYIPFAVFSCFGILGMLASAFLPETFGTRLPETVDDASHIGSGTKFWSFKPASGKLSSSK